MNENTDWASAIAILTAGLILGLMFIYFVSRRRSAAPPADLELRDLEAKRDLLVDPDAGLRGLTNYTFYVAFSALLFRSMRNVRLDQLDAGIAARERRRTVDRHDRIGCKQRPVARGRVDVRDELAHDVLGCDGGRGHAQNRARSVTPHSRGGPNVPSAVPKLP